MKNSRSLDTLFAQANGAIDAQTGGVIPPLQSSTTFVRNENNELTSPDHSYARDQNDLLRLGEEMLAQAEHAQGGVLLPSGMAAAASIIRSVPNGGRIVIQSGIYWGVTKFARDYCARREVELVEVDCSELDGTEQAIAGKKTNIIWIETPSNPYLKSVDIGGCAELAKAVGASLVVDSTAATPVLSRPLDHGADVVMHSATKGINGHSDVLAGFLGFADKASELWEHVRIDRHGAGAMLGSFEAWLLIRGMRTLPLRVERMSASAMTVAKMLEEHPSVSQVMYPGLATDPGYAVAIKQMTGGFGGLLSARVKGGRSAALKAAGRLKIFKRATSLGGVESLVEHRHTIEETVPDDLLRFSVGIENADDLVADLQQALA